MIFLKHNSNYNSNFRGILKAAQKLYHRRREKGSTSSSFAEPELLIGSNHTPYHMSSNQSVNTKEGLDSDLMEPQFYWIASDGWGKQSAVVAEMEEFALGAITVELESKKIAGFDDYMTTLTPEDNDRNMW